MTRQLICPRPARLTPGSDPLIVHDSMPDKFKLKGVLTRQFLAQICSHGLAFFIVRVRRDNGACLLISSHVPRVAHDG